METIERPGPGETTQKSTFKHASNGDLESETDPLGHETKFEYDTYGDVKASTDAEGDKTTWGYNTDGFQTSEVSPRGNEEGAKAAEFETTTERDAQNRPTKVTDPLGHETKFAYDKNGNLETLTDGNGHVTKYTYDADNEHDQSRSGQRDDDRNRLRLDGLGEIENRRQRQNDEIRTQRARAADRNDRPARTQNDPRIRQSREPRKTERPGSADDHLHLRQSEPADEKELLRRSAPTKSNTPTTKTPTSPKWSTAPGRPKRPTTSSIAPRKSKTATPKSSNTNITSANLLTKITYPNSKAVTREYDKANRLSKVTDWLTHSTTFAYNRDSELKGTTFPTTAVDEDVSEYDRADQLSKHTFKKGAETLASLSYTRDKVGNIESTTQTGLPGTSPSYEYDKANRLTKGAGTTFEYDNAGNPKKIGATELKYDAASQLEKAGTTTYAFNTLGQRTKATPEGGSETKYGWDQAANLITIKRTSPAIEDSYGYDGNGLRQLETISGTTKHLAWDTAEPLPLVLYDGTNYYVYGPEEVPIEQIASETSTYLHHDQAGSTRLLTSQAGTTSGAYTFTPYGSTESHTGTATSNLLYDGQYTSPDTGLIYLRARVYDPTTAQFMSVDPHVATTGDAYGFAGQSPVNGGDPTGLQKGIWSPWPPPPPPRSYFFDTLFPYYGKQPFPIILVPEPSPFLPWNPIFDPYPSSVFDNGELEPKPPEFGFFASLILGLEPGGSCKVGSSPYGLMQVYDTDKTKTKLPFGIGIYYYPFGSEYNPPDKYKPSDIVPWDHYLPEYLRPVGSDSSYY